MPKKIMGLQSDLPRDELMKRADDIIKALGGEALIHFKYTCEKCQARVMIEEPNTLYAYGECCLCGHKTKIERGGFTLIFATVQLNEKKKNGA